MKYRTSSIRDCGTLGRMHPGPLNEFAFLLQLEIPLRHFQLALVDVVSPEVQTDPLVEELHRCVSGRAVLMEDACRSAGLCSNAGPDEAPSCRLPPLLRPPALFAPYFFNVTSPFHWDQNLPPSLLMSLLQARSLCCFYAIPLKQKRSQWWDR